MNRARPLHATVFDDDVSVVHKLDADAAPPLSVDVLPIPFANLFSDYFTNKVDRLRKKIAHSRGGSICFES